MKTFYEKMKETRVHTNDVTPQYLKELYTDFKIKEYQLMCFTKITGYNFMIVDDCYFSKVDLFALKEYYRNISETFIKNKFVDYMQYFAYYQSAFDLKFKEMTKLLTVEIDSIVESITDIGERMKKIKCSDAFLNLYNHVYDLLNADHFTLCRIIREYTGL